MSAGALESAATECAPVLHTMLAAPDGRRSRADGRARALCVPRVVFDAILWRHAVDAGCRPMHQSVRDVRSVRREYDLVVDARGAHAGTPNAVALRAYWTLPRGLLAPVNAQTLMYMIWATTQHYADFDAQIRALKGKRALTQKAFDATTEEVVQLVIRACGAVSPAQHEDGADPAR